MSRLRTLLRRALFTALKSVGVFGLARRWSEGRLRIVGWHGLSAVDEHHYDDVLFMRPRTFLARLELLARLGAQVLPLDEALERLSSGSLPPMPVVLTIDDGWASSASFMAAALARHRFPATLYVATDYTDHPWFPVFDVATGWLLWRVEVRGGPREVDLSAVDRTLGVLDLSTTQQRKQAHARLRERGDALSVVERTHLVTSLALALDEDVTSPAFQSANATQLAQLAAHGIDLQLHTHHHRLPLDEATLAEELEQNRTVLRRASPRPLEHLCFPSGEYRREHLGHLERLGVNSAVTCLPGLNDARTPRLELRRFLDRDSLSSVEVEAELCGVSEWLREQRRRIGRRRATATMKPGKEQT